MSKKEMKKVVCFCGGRGGKNTDPWRGGGGGGEYRFSEFENKAAASNG